MNPVKKVIEARPLPVLPTHSHRRSAPLPVLFLACGSGLHSPAFSRRSGRGLIGGKVRRGGSSAAVAEGGPYSDDPSRDERPANYDPNGEQLDAASQQEPGIISGKGQCSHHHPHEDPKKEEDRSQDSLANSSAMSPGHRRVA